MRENVPTSEFSGKSKKNWTGQNISDGKDIKWSCQGIKKQHVLFCMWRVSLAMRLETVDLYACNAQVWFLLGEISQGSPDRFWILLWLLTCDDNTVIGFLWKNRQCTKRDYFCRRKWIKRDTDKWGLNTSVVIWTWQKSIVFSTQFCDVLLRSSNQFDTETGYKETRAFCKMNCTCIYRALFYTVLLLVESFLCNFPFSLLELLNEPCIHRLNDVHIYVSEPLTINQ